ncbi:unnamed protein product, partial [Thlaspi arvense]
MNKGKPFKGGSVCPDRYCSVRNASTEERRSKFKFTFKLNHSWYGPEEVFAPDRIASTEEHSFNFTFKLSHSWRGRNQ